MYFKMLNIEKKDKKVEKQVYIRDDILVTYYKANSW